MRWITPSPQFIKNAMKVATKAGALICPPSTNTDCGARLEGRGGLALERVTNCARNQDDDDRRPGPRRLS